jgi:predicted PolB exonuclease-like 3'-5' exonuclease
MLRPASINPIWFLDAEWVPDVVRARQMFHLAGSRYADTPEGDEQVREWLYQKAGATAEKPTPYLKTAWCRIVSLAVLVRKELRPALPSPEVPNRKVTLSLLALPDLVTGSAWATRPDEEPEQRNPTEDRDGFLSEKPMLERFWNGIASQHPQLVGYNVGSADLTIALQRALVHGVVAPGAFLRPNKPWEGFDYFDDRNSQMIVDLKRVISPFDARDLPSLGDFAVSCGLPGKPWLGEQRTVSGNDVLPMWVAGAWRDIVAYNTCDSFVTYLLWLRAMVASGQIAVEDAAEETGQLLTIARAQAEREAACRQGQPGIIGAWLRQAEAAPGLYRLS